MIRYEWRGAFDNEVLERLHAEAFGHAPVDGADWVAQLTEHSLGWVCGREGDELVGFVYVAWDGGAHAFILDPMVAVRLRRHGIGAELVAAAVRQARAAGCEWLHVDFDDHLRAFYLDTCGFTPTPAGLIRL